MKTFRLLDEQPKYLPFDSDRFIRIYRRKYLLEIQGEIIRCEEALEKRKKAAKE